MASRPRKTKDAGKGHEHQAEQTVRFCDDDGRGLRAAFLRNTVSTCERATSSKDHEKAIDKLETTKQSTNTLHNWFQKKQKHPEESSQESIQAHPEARSSNDTDMMQVIEPMTTDAEHINKAQKIMADEHTMSMGVDVEHTEPMQIDTQEHSAQECIFSKKTIAQHRANITCATCHAARNRGSRMRVCARCGRMHCAQCKPPETKCEAKERAKQGTDEQKEPEATTQQREKEKGKGKTHTSMAMNNVTKKDNEDTDALDAFLRKIQERGPAPATMEWIPRTVRPRITTIMIKLLSESAQAAELANENESDAIRWRTSTLLYAAPSILLSKPKKQVQSDDDGKEGRKESNQMKMLKEIRRRLQLAEKGEWHKLLGNHLEDYASKTKKTKKEEDTGEGSQ